MRARLLPLILLVACSVSAREQPTRIPSMQLATLDGDARASIAEATAGKVALVNFWATWCTACEKEFDALNRLDARARDRGAIVIGVAVGESIATVGAFVRRRGLAYRQLVDEDFRLADAIGARRVPTTFVLDRSGRIVHASGSLDAATLEAFSAELRK